MIYNGARCKVPILAAVGIRPTGKWEMLGFRVGDRENQLAWEDLLEALKEQGHSNNEPERLAGPGTSEALDNLHQALDTHQTQLKALQEQHKAGRNALERKTCVETLEG